MFKRSTAKLEELLKGTGIKITVNAEKPRKGTWEVTIGGKKMASLVAMPRPFKKLRELDMEDLAKKIKADLGFLGA